MGERRVMQEALFYGFSLERHVPDNHLLRKIDRFVDLSEVRTHLEPYYLLSWMPSPLRGIRQTSPPWHIAMPSGGGIHSITALSLSRATG